MTLDDIASLAERCPDLQVYSPPAKQRDTITPAAERNRRSQLKHEPQAVKDWRGRMASEEGKATYRRRKLTEHAHAKMKNRGFARMAVHGIDLEGLHVSRHLLTLLVAEDHLEDVGPGLTRRAGGSGEPGGVHRAD